MGGGRVAAPHATVSKEKRLLQRPRRRRGGARRHTRAVATKMTAATGGSGAWRRAQPAKAKTPVATAAVTGGGRGAAPRATGSRKNAGGSCCGDIGGGARRHARAAAAKSLAATAVTTGRGGGAAPRTTGIKKNADDNRHEYGGGRGGAPRATVSNEKRRWQRPLRRRGGARRHARAAPTKTTAATGGRGARCRAQPTAAIPPAAVAATAVGRSGRRVCERIWVARGGDVLCGRRHVGYRSACHVS